MFPLVPDPTAPPPVSAIPPAPSSSVAASLAQPLAEPFTASLPGPFSASPAEPTPPPAGPAPVGPDAALSALLAGNRRFVSGQPWYGHQVRRATAVSSEPRPFAVVVGCMDSRVPVEAVLDQDFGSIFVVRSAGHVLDRVTRGSIDLAVVSMGVPLVLVLGHRRCAAVATAVNAWRNHTRLGGTNVGHVVDEIFNAIRETAPDRVTAVDPVARRHTARTVARMQSSYGSQARVVGAFYDVDNGNLELM